MVQNKFYNLFLSDPKFAFLVAELSVIFGKFQTDRPTVEKDETLLKKVYCFQLISPNTNIGFPKIPISGPEGKSQRPGLSHLGAQAGN